MSFIFYKKLIKVYKVFKNNKGLNTINYISTTIIGDKNGGFGIGRASNTNQIVSNFKSLGRAKKNFIKISLKNKTIPYPIIGKSCCCLIYLYPSNNVYNFSCGSYLRSIFDVMGIYNITAKIYGSGSFYNILNSIVNALFTLKSYFFVLKKCS